MSSNNNGYKTQITMIKRLTFTIIAAVTLTACGGNDKSITIDDQNALNAAYEMSEELATKVAEAKTYEEFKAARQALDAAEEAFRTQIGGETYILFLEECNYIINKR